MRLLKTIQVRLIANRARRALLKVSLLAMLVPVMLIHYPVRASAAEPPAAKILVLGDSLSAEYGLARGTGWVALLAADLSRRAPHYQIVNASISGDTTAGGLQRLRPLLERHRPTIVMIELGGNDALRGLDLTGTEQNIRQMIRLARSFGARVILLGMQVPPNYGSRYSNAFAAIYPRVASAEKTALVPFLLEGVAQRSELFQPDRIHPGAKAQSIMLSNVWPVLQPLL